MSKIVYMNEWKKKRRRGLPRQRARLRCEREVRMAVVALVRHCRRRGIRLKVVAKHLGVSPQTLRRWERRWRRDRMALHPRGRPPVHTDRAVRQLILEILQEMGPETGLPTLRKMFPGVARAELQELQRHARFRFRRRRKWLVHVLNWTQAGIIWAMDFSDPPAAIDGVYTKLLCIRDLASGYQLTAIPCRDKSTGVALDALDALVRWHGAPLVLKCDNEGAYRSNKLKSWARRNNVLLLFSPVVTPEYNGAIEAGIGSIKVRAHYQAARHGRPGEWTCDDIEAAVQQANETALPKGLGGPTPEKMWEDRKTISGARREMFYRTYRKHHARECTERGLYWNPFLRHGEQATIDRAAIRRSLVEHGYLVFRRRRISLPNSRRKKRIIR
jgi:transposase